MIMFSLSILKLNAQNDCSTAYEYASEFVGTSFATVTNTSAPVGPNYGCLSSCSNPTWIYLQICVPGNIAINIISNGVTDVDFVAWGPFSNQANMCSGIFGGTSAIDCSFATSTTEQVNFSNVAVGEFYMILVSNFSNQPGTFTLTAVAGTTGASCDSTGIPAPFPVCTYPTQQICKVSTNNVVNKNVIVWNEDNAFVGDYNVQREATTMNVFSTIGTVSSVDSTTFQDPISNPIQQSYRYRIQSVDTCGNITYSYPHKTIHLLTNYNTFTGYPQLAWNNYQGFNYPTHYIYRGTSPQTLSLYDSISVSFTSYTDVAPLAGTNYYSIAVNPPVPCTPLRAIDLSFSNVSPVLVTSIEELGESLITVYPNPGSGIINVSFGSNIVSGKLSLVDITGRELMMNHLQNINQFQLDASDFAAGFYYLMLQTDTGTVRKNIIVSK